MAQSSNMLIVGVVVALVIGAAVGWFAYPAMNPIPSLEDYVAKSTYDELQTLYDDAEAELVDVSSELSEAKSSLGSALAEGVLADIMLKELKELTVGKKVGLVMATGGLGDKSFNDISYAGVQMAEEKLGIEFDYVEPTAIAEYEGFQRDFAMTGEYEIIICIGFDQADALSVIADEYPNQKFAIVDMVVDKDNVASLIFRANEGSFLVGVVAGLVTETGKVGFIGGMDIPLIRDFFVGYEAGVVWANSDVEVLEPVFVGDWADPTRGKELGTSLVELGADGIFVAAGKSGLGGLEAAHEQGIYGYGVDACQCYLYPEVIASMTKRVDNAVFQMILSALAGTFEGGTYNGGLAESWVGMCRLPEEEEPFWEYVFEFDHVDIPEEILEKAFEARDKIVSGEIIVPSGYT
jgi:basic membrane protein A